MNLTIKKNDYGLRVYCTKCKKQYNYNIDICSHSENQHYKSLVSNGDGRKAKMYQTRDFDEALMSAIQFKQDVKNGVLDNFTSSNKIDTDNISILEASNMFLAFKHGDDVPVHLKNEITDDHLKDIIRNVQQFMDVLRDNNINVETMLIQNLNDNHVGLWYQFVIDNYAEGSYSTKLKIMSAFINHMINQVGILMRNPFKKVRFESLEYNTESISKVEFYGVLDAIDTKSQYQQLGGKRQEVKNNYRPYLKDGFRLALLTGLRREELVTLSWSDLYHSEKNGCLMFITDNLKVERMTGKRFKKKFIPVGPDLMEFLMELGYEDFKDSDLFILAPNRKVKHATIMSALSRGFSHYYMQAFPDNKLKQFKVLRKTYISYLNKKVGDSVIELTSHGSMKIVNKHYVDAEVVAKGLTMRIFDS